METILQHDLPTDLLADMAGELPETLSGDQAASLAYLVGDECLTMGRLWGLVQGVGVACPVVALRRLLAEVEPPVFDRALLALVGDGILIGYRGQPMAHDGSPGERFVPGGPITDLRLVALA